MANESAYINILLWVKVNTFQGKIFKKIRWNCLETMKKCVMITFQNILSTYQLFGSKLTESVVSDFKPVKRFSAAYKEPVVGYFWSRKDRPTEKPVPFGVSGMGHTSRHAPGLSPMEVGTAH